MIKLLTLFCLGMTTFSQNNALYNFNWHNTFISVPIQLTYQEQQNYQLKPILAAVSDNDTGSSISVNEFDIFPTNDLYEFGHINFKVPGTYRVLYRAKHKQIDDCFDDVVVTYKLLDNKAPTLQNATITQKPINLRVGADKYNAKDFMLKYFVPMDNYSNIRQLNNEGNNVDPLLLLHEEIIGFNLINFNKIGLYNYTYRIIDGTKNESSYHGQINVIDDQAPTIEAITSAFEVVQGEMINIHNFFTFSDNYDKHVKNITITPQQITKEQEAVTISAIDSNNNKQIKTVLFRGIRRKPVIILKTQTLSIDCEEEELLPKIKNLISNIENITSEEENMLQIKHNLGAKGPYQSGQYYATLQILNSDIYKIVIKVFDKNAPIINKKIPDQSLVFEYQSSVLLSDFLQYFHIYDLIDNQNIEIKINPQINTNHLGRQAITITAIDMTGNKNLHTEIINIIDNELPQIKVKANKKLELMEDEYFDYKKFFDISDNHKIKEVNLKNYYYPLPGIFTDTIEVIDYSNNKSIYTFVIMVLEKAPKIILRNNKVIVNIFSENIQAELKSNLLRIDYNKHNYTLDNIKISADVNLKELGEGEVIYTLSNKDSQLTSASAKVIVKDLIPPISHPRVSPIEIPVFTPNFNIYDYYTFSDNFTPSDQIRVKLIEGNLNLKVVGNYFLKYLLTDTMKNESIISTYVRVVDNIAPEINIAKTEFTTNLNQRINFKELITSSDNYSKKVFLSIEDHEVNYKKIGTYKVYVSAKDENQNITRRELLITIIDNISPLLILKNKYLQHIINEQPQDLLTNIDLVSDNISPLNNNNVVIEHNIDYNYPGYYDIIYHVKDESGNIAIEQAKIFVNYKHPPKIALKHNKIDLKELTSEALINVCAIDDKRDCLIELATDINTINRAGNYNLTFLVTDELGIMNEQTLNIKITSKKHFTISIILIFTLLILGGCAILISYLILRKHYARANSDFDNNIYNELGTSISENETALYEK